MSLCCHGVLTLYWSTSSVLYYTTLRFAIIHKFRWLDIFHVVHNVCSQLWFAIACIAFVHPLFWLPSYFFCFFGTIKAWFKLPAQTCYPIRVRRKYEPGFRSVTCLLGVCCCLFCFVSCPLSYHLVWYLFAFRLLRFVLCLSSLRCIS